MPEHESGVTTRSTNQKTAGQADLHAIPVLGWAGRGGPRSITSLGLQDSERRHERSMASWVVAECVAQGAR
jgi:hypothetical protein